MAKQLYRDFTDPKVVKSIDEIIKKLGELKAATIETAKQLQKDLRIIKPTDIEKLTEASKKINKLKQDIDKITKAETELNKQRKNTVKLQEKFKQSTSANAKEQAKLRVQIQEQNKANKIAAQQKLGLIGAYKKESQRLIELRTQYKNLAVQEKANTKEGKRLLNTINQLDAKLKRVDASVGQYQRNVGNYASAWRGVRSSLMKVAAVTGTALGFRALARGVTNTINAYREQVKAEAKVRQAIVSTQGAAQRSFEQLTKQASELQKTTLFGDEEILNNATAQLLTFTNIAGDNFDRTQAVALDLATVLDGDLKSSSIQLGKALNDPVANLSALSRSGIQFSEDQKKVIKELASTNRLAEAQTVILDELERQYGGQAEAAAKADGGFKQLSNTWGDLMESIGAGVTRFLRPLIGFIGDVVSGINDWFKSSTPLTDAIEDERTQVVKLTATLKSNVANQKDKIKAYNELNKISPKLVEGIDKENIAIDQLNKNLREYLDLAAKRIVVARKQDELNEEVEDAASAYSRLLDIEQDIIRLYDEQGITIENSADVLNKYNELLNKSSSAAFDVKLKIELYKKALNQLNEAQEKSVDLQKEINDLRERFGLNEQETPDENKPEQQFKKGAKAAEEYKEALEDVSDAEAEIGNDIVGLEELEERSAERYKEIQEEKTDVLLMEADKRAQAEKKYLDEVAELRRKKLKELRDFAIDQAAEEIQRVTEKRIEAADAALEANKTQIDLQTRLAEKGADNTLQFEKDQQAKSLLEKQKALKQQEIAQKIAAFWNLLANSQNPQEAIAKYGLGEAFAATIRALPAFKEGVIDFDGVGTTTSDSNIVRISKGESVINADSTARYRDELTAINQGNFDQMLQHKMIVAGMNNNPVSDMAIQKVVAEQIATRKAIEQGLPNIEGYFDKVNEQIVTVFKYKNKTNVVKNKLPRL